jgi:hypothetical protein
VRVRRYREIGASVIRSGDFLFVKSDIGLSVDSDITLSGPTPSCYVAIAVLVTVKFCHIVC